jgi:hypothetical protein
MSLPQYDLQVPKHYTEKDLTPFFSRYGTVSPGREFMHPVCLTCWLYLQRLDAHAE